MKNIEKYKDIILDNTDLCSINRLLLKNNIKGFCSGFSCVGCGVRAIKWLLEEVKEPVLDDVEKEYLSNVIAPFRRNVNYICKRLSENGYYIIILVNEFDVMNLPYFPKNTMYKGMKVDYRYTLKELGL